MKDWEDADVILNIKQVREGNDEITLSQSHHIKKKVLKSLWMLWL